MSIKKKFIEIMDYMIAIKISEITKANENHTLDSVVIF